MKLKLEIEIKDIDKIFYIDKSDIEFSKNNAIKNIKKEVKLLFYKYYFDETNFNIQKIEIVEKNEFEPKNSIPLKNYINFDFTEDVQEVLSNYSYDYILNNTLRLPYFVIEEFKSKGLDVFNELK